MSRLPLVLVSFTAALAACSSPSVTDAGVPVVVEDAGSCRQDGRTCIYDESCCSGECIQGTCRQCVTAGACDDVDTFCCGGLSCQSGQCNTACLLAGSNCGGAAQCCPDAQCVAEKCEACRPLGTGCTGAMPCCSGSECRAQGCRACSIQNGNCSQSVDCCNQAECDGGVCGAPRCQFEGSGCGASGGSCCPGLFCIADVCRTCVGPSGACPIGTECCAGLTCNAGTCTGTSSGGGGTCRGFGQVCNAIERCCHPTICRGGTCGY